MWLSENFTLCTVTCIIFRLDSVDLNDVTVAWLCPALTHPSADLWAQQHFSFFSVIRQWSILLWDIHSVYSVWNASSSLDKDGSFSSFRFELNVSCSEVSPLNIPSKWLSYHFLFPEHSSYSLHHICHELITSFLLFLCFTHSSSLIPQKHL